LVSSTLVSSPAASWAASSVAGVRSRSGTAASADADAKPSTTAAAMAANRF
jgi:hypothetical protein